MKDIVLYSLAGVGLVALFVVVAFICFSVWWRKERRRANAAADEINARRFRGLPGFDCHD